MTSFSSASERLAAKLQEPITYGLQQIEKAAHAAAERTNVALAREGVPARAVVIKKASGYRVMLHRTGPITQRFTGMTPNQLLAKNVRDEMSAAARSIQAKGQS